jgi:hypothetical protein
MELLLALALRVGLLLYAVIVPGFAVLRAAGFASRSKLDWLLAVLTAGAAATSLTVTTLLLVGIYYRPLLIVLLLLPLGYLASSAMRPRTVAGLTGGAEAPPYVQTGSDAIDRAVIVAAIAFLAVYLIDAWTSPITWWDGLASWGKWAADWGRRTSSAHYVVGGYPQLVPRIVSVMYKLTGAHSAVLPIDFFALHGFFVLLSAWFLVAAVRLSRLLDMPAWPVVLAGLGSIQFREHSGAGTVDVLVCAMITSLLALYFGLRRGTWRARAEYAILGAAAFAAIFTKWTGGIGILFLLVLHRAARSPYPLSAERASQLGRTVRWSLAIAAVGMLPFLIEQGASELRIGRWVPDPFEVNISLRQIPTLLSTDANIVYRGGDAAVRAGLVQLRFWNSYDVPSSLRLVFTALLSVCLLASLMTWFGRAALPVLAGYGAIWLYWSSYDQRNIFGLLSVLGLAVSFGGAWLWRARPQLVWTNVIAVGGGLFLVLAGGGLLKDMQARVAAMTRGERPLPARVEAMRGTTADKVALFYPLLDKDYRFVSGLAARTDAAHVLVTYPMFRFFERGAHALSLWPFDRVRAGDVFAGHEYHAPPADPRWVLLSRQPGYRVWINVPALEPVTPSVPAGDDGSGVQRILYRPSPAMIDRSGLVVWRATVPDVGSEPALVHDARPGLLDDSLTSGVCEAPAKGSSVYTCSGVVALRLDSVPGFQEGELTVGVEVDGRSSGVTLSVARPLPAPAAPPQ